MSGPLISSREVTWELAPPDPADDINMDWPGIKHYYITYIHTYNIYTSQWFWAQFGRILVETKCQLFSFKMVFMPNLMLLVAKLLTYDVFCTPKVTGTHAFIAKLQMKPIENH